MVYVANVKSVESKVHPFVGCLGFGLKRDRERESERDTHIMKNGHKYFSYDQVLEHFAMRPPKNRRNQKGISLHYRTHIYFI